MHVVLRFCMLCLALSLVAVPASAAQTAVMRTEVGNSYDAGSELSVNQAVPGDLFAAGGHVMVERPVGADAAVAGGAVDIRSAVGQDLRAAGGRVSIGGAVGGELLAAGGDVSIVDGAAVSGPALLAGSEVTVDGRLGRGAKIYANRIIIDGEIDGDARFYGREIRFGPRARIDGNLFYASAVPLPEEQLTHVWGRVVREQTPQAWNNDSRCGGIGFHLLFFLSMLASGVVLYLLFPNAIDGVRGSIASAPWRSVALGLALLFTLPPVALLLMLTLIGLPLGLGVFVLYPFLLMLGYLGAAFFISRKLATLLRRESPSGKGRQVLFLAAALLLLGIAGAIPILGWLFVFLSLTAGVGGWAIWASRRYRHSASMSG